MSNTCIRPASTLASRVGCWCLPIYQSAMAPFASRRTLQRLAQDLRRVPPQRRISLLDSDHDGDDAAIRPLDVCHFALGKLGDLNGSKGRGERRGRDAPRRDKTRQSDSIRFASLHFTSLHFTSLRSLSLAPLLFTTARPYLQVIVLDPIRAAQRLYELFQRSVLPGYGLSLVNTAGDATSALARLGRLGVVKVKPHGLSNESETWIRASQSIDRSIDRSIHE